MLFGARERLASCWLDLAEGRLRLDRLNRNGGRIDFLPLRFAHSSREPRKSPAAILRCAAAPTGAASIASGFQIAIEAAAVAGSKQAKEK